MLLPVVSIRTFSFRVNILLDKLDYVDARKCSKRQRCSIPKNSRPKLTRLRSCLKDRSDSIDAKIYLIFSLYFCTIFSLPQYYPRRSASNQAHMQERQSAIVPYTQFLIFFLFITQINICSSHFRTLQVENSRRFQPSAHILHLLYFSTHQGSFLPSNNIILTFSQNYFFTFRLFSLVFCPCIKYLRFLNFDLVPLHSR